MNLVMLDIDGTLTQSYDYDKEIFGLAIAEVLGSAPVDADVNDYVIKTSTGVTQEAIRRITGRSATMEEIEEVKRNVQRRLERLFHESPEIFSEIPGADHFLERLGKLNGIGVAIATGCWRNEALFKLQASGLHVDDIPMATSDDERSRTRIMQLAAEKSGDFYACPGFKRIVYLGDGPWDLQEARSLGYGFIGIGMRVRKYLANAADQWHPDFVDLEAVFASVMTELRA